MKRLASLLAIIVLIAPSLAFAAIAFDTSANKAIGASPATQSYTVTGSDAYLVVCAHHTSVSDTVTSVTFGATSLTNQTYAAMDAGGNLYSISMWGGAVAAGTENITVTTSSGNVGFSAASYSGVLNGVDHATTTGQGYQASSATLAFIFIPSTSNNWSVMCQTDGAGIPTAGTGATRRTGSVFPALFDSNGTITNPHTMNVNWSGSGAGLYVNAVGISLNPNAPVSATAFYSTAPWWYLFW